MSKDRIVGFFPGVWDLLHPGHLRALNEARVQCDDLLVAVNIYPTNKNPIYSAQERVEMLDPIEWIASVGTYKDDEALYKIDKLGKAYRPNRFGKPYRCRIDVRFMGEDHNPSHPIKAKVIKISRDHDYSTTAIKARIRRG